MQGRRDNATVTHLNLQPRTQQKASHGNKFWYLTHRPHTRISPNPFGTNSGNTSELRYSSGGRGGTQNDWEKQKCLRLIVYQGFEGRLDTDIRLHCGRFKKISYTTELVAQYMQHLHGYSVQSTPIATWEYEIWQQSRQISLVFVP